LWRPEEELDGCEPEPERGPAADSLPGTPPGPPDGLRQDSLELISRYLREVAGEAQPSAKKLFPGLLGGPGRPGAAGDAVMEKALETLRRVGDGVMRKHELAFQGGCRPGTPGRRRDPRSLLRGQFQGPVPPVAVARGALGTGPGAMPSWPGHWWDVALAGCPPPSPALLSTRGAWQRALTIPPLSQEGFVDFFRVEDLEGSIRNVLMAFAGVAGLGASLAYMIR
ncbi:MCL1 protein, partial [Chloropsis hardwickii]|nr:MCL1 protein [Chloropsis hardwickii]